MKAGRPAISGSYRAASAEPGTRSAPKTPVSMTTGPRIAAAERSIDKAGEERGTLVFAQVLDDHLLMRRQGPGAVQQFLNGEFKVPRRGGLKWLDRHKPRFSRGAPRWRD
jgi:hypothetical protein